MIRKIISYSLTFVIVITLLTYYNYQRAQSNLLSRRDTKFSITLTDFPDQISLDGQAHFSWSVDSPESFTAKSTGIIYGYDSSPSALTKLDSPAAVGYPDYTKDFASGKLRLPANFDLDIKFNKEGIVYYRAYALIDNDHLWTDERQLRVVKNEK